MAVRSSHTGSRKSLTRKGSPEKGSVLSTDSRRLEASAFEQPATPLFVRIYAHVLSVAVMEKAYPPAELKKMSLQTTKEISRVAPLSTRDAKTPLSRSRDVTTPSTTRTGRQAGGRIRGSSGRLTSIKPDTPATVIGNEAAAAKCRDVLYDVMEALVMDVLTSSTIQEALQDQLMPLPRSDRALNHVPTDVTGTSHLPDSLHRAARQNDDCQAIVAGVMENTVFNVLQELFYGDLEQELLCVPRNEVFPNANASSPSRPAGSVST